MDLENNQCGIEIEMMDCQIVWQCVCGIAKTHIISPAHLLSNNLDADGLVERVPQMIQK